MIATYTSHPDPYRLKDPWGRGDQDIIKSGDGDGEEWGRTVPPGCRGNAGLRSSSVVVVACPRSSLSAFQHGVGRRSWAPTLTEELVTVGGFGGEGESISLRVWILVGWPCSSGWLHGMGTAQNEVSRLWENKAKEKHKSQHVGVGSRRWVWEEQE